MPSLLGQGGEVGPGGGDFGGHGDEAVRVFGGDAAEPGGEGWRGRLAEFDGGENFSENEHGDVELGRWGLFNESAESGGKCAVDDCLQSVGVEEIVHRLRPGKRRATSLMSGFLGGAAAGGWRRNSLKGLRWAESCS